jgi:ubiquinol-cytochrome c reductase iron-sulfur subunit
MAQHEDSTSVAQAGSALEKAEPGESSPGTAIVASDGFENPGLPPRHERVTDLDPKAERRAEHRVGGLFLVSVIGSVFAIVAYIIFPIVPGNTGSIRLNTMLLGVGIALGSLGIGIGAISWAKTLMSNEEIAEPRHPSGGSPETKARAVEIFKVANEESGFGRRTLIRRTLIGALVVSPLPAVVMLRDLAPAQDPVPLLDHTMWAKDMRLTDDPTGVPIKASDVTIGSFFHVIPEGLNNKPDRLEEKAKAAVLLMRLRPEDLHPSPDRKDWAYQGIVAYSKICTHVGCPVALYEQQTHHLLCPCHQSQFDVTHQCEVIFGPAKRPLPQLPITVNAEGYLIAQSDFHEPVGPSFWERS